MSRDPRYPPGCAVFVVLIVSVIAWALAIAALGYVTRSPDAGQASGMPHNLQGTGQ